MNVQWDMDMESSMALRAILCCVGLSCRLQDTCHIQLSTPIMGPTKTHSTDFQDAHQGVAPSPLWTTAADVNVIELCARRGSRNACWIEWLRTLQILTTIVLNFNSHGAEAVVIHGRSRQGEPNVLVFQAYPNWLAVALNITYRIILRVVSSLFNHSVLSTGHLC